MNGIADPVWSGAIAYRCRVDSAVLARKMPEHRTLTGLVIVGIGVLSLSFCREILTFRASIVAKIRWAASSRATPM